MSIRSILSRHGISQYQLAKAMDLDASTISRKLCGNRPWKADELRTVRDFFAERGIEISYEEMLAADEPEPLAQAAEG